MIQLGYILASLNAALNGLAALLLLGGFWAIRQGKMGRHKKFMVAAFSVSIIFLISYLIRFYLTGTHRYPGTGFFRNLYLGVLLSHTTLAATVPFLAVRTFYLAVKQRFESHRKIARVTWPVWMYVSLTGVLIYFMLYHWAPNGI